MLASCNTVICRVGNSLLSFLSELLVFCQKNERMSNLLKKVSNSLIRSFLVSDLSDSLMDAHFFGERPERFAHSRSFLVSDLSDLLTSLRGNEQIFFLFNLQKNVKTY